MNIDLQQGDILISVLNRIFSLFGESIGVVIFIGLCAGAGYLYKQVID